MGSQRLKVMWVFLSLGVRCTLQEITYAVHELPSRNMTKDSSQPYPRPRRKRGSLSPEVILDAAEAVAEQGFEAFSMRAVAARLGAVPMALYNHFATKEQLVAALLDRVLGRFEPPEPTDDWLEDLRAFARAHRQLLAQPRVGRRADLHQPEPGAERGADRRAGDGDPQARRPHRLAGGRRVQRPDRDQLRLGVVHRRPRPQRRGHVERAPGRGLPDHGRDRRRMGRLRRRRALRVRARRVLKGARPL